MAGTHRADVPKSDMLGMPGSAADIAGMADHLLLSLTRQAAELVDRQLTVLDGLERDEENTARLTELYELDHLAAQVRRHAHGIAVLSHGTGPRHHDTASLHDLMHSAVSGVRDYRRVVVGAAPDRSVVADAAADLALVLTELVDLALGLVPGAEVRVAMSAVSNGAVVDIHAPGQATSELLVHRVNLALSMADEEALVRLGGTGLVIAGRLARAQGAHITLRHAADRRVVVSIHLPQAVFVDRDRTSRDDLVAMLAYTGPQHRMVAVS